MADPIPFSDLLSPRPLLIVVAGPNGAGKSTFVHAFLADMGLRFINADVLTREFGLDPRHGADAADALRREMIQQRESFITETVFSDPVGAKLGMFTQAMTSGYTVVLLFIGISGPDRSDERVAMRVSQGGHDVPYDRLVARYPRTLANVRAAISALSEVVVYDNDDLRRPFRCIAHYHHGVQTFVDRDLPQWWTRS